MLAGLSGSGCYSHVQIMCLDKLPNNTNCSFMKEKAMTVSVFIYEQSKDCHAKLICILRWIKFGNLRYEILILRKVSRVL